MMTQGLLASFTSVASPITWLIAYWKFANGADTTEYTGTYNLTKTGTPTIGTDRLWNTAWFSAFTTSDYFSHATFLDAWLTAWTFFVWFKATGTTRQFMISKGSNTYMYPFELVTDTAGKLTLYIDSDETPWLHIYTSTTSVNTWNWVFAIMSWDSSSSSSLSMNINWGSAEWTLAGNGSSWGSIWTSTAYDFYIWNRWDISEAYINWSIWECWFCNRVLTSAEKQRLYDESSAQYIVPNILTT